MKSARYHQSPRHHLFLHQIALHLSLAALLVVAAAGAAQATGSMSTARDGHSATRLANGTVLVVGGYNNSGPLASAEIYHPATGTFSPPAAWRRAGP
jgi:hypothetical protein